jgi:putative tryptophan/tyrosine transport system substrate-binding protein
VVRDATSPYFDALFGGHMTRQTFRLDSAGIKRRQFIKYVGTAVAVWPMAAGAQQTGMRRIGILNFDNGDRLRTLLGTSLADLGYEEGKNAQLEYKTAGGDRTRLRQAASELVGARPDLIVAYPTPAVVAVRQITPDIPIVMLGAGDPVATGLVASLSRPGGNITGTASATAEAGAKSLDVIRDMLPDARRVAILANATDPFTKSFLERIQPAANEIGLHLEIIMIGQPDRDLEGAFAAIESAGASAVIVQPTLPRIRVAELAIQKRLPSIAPGGGFANDGGLATYSGNWKEMARRTAAIIDKVLKGAKPADLPVEQPTTFELVINLKTAKTIGVEIPSALLARADEVIE